MPRVATLAECRELQRVSGWAAMTDHGQYPCYTTDMLLSLLPAHSLTKLGNATWQARWVGHVPWQSETPAPPPYRGAITAESRTNPANALARLAIKLFGAGVLLTSKGE